MYARMNEEVTVGYLQMAHLYFISTVLKPTTQTKPIICAATKFKYKLIATAPVLGLTVLGCTSSLKNVETVS
jgi:hypothetical protein